MPDERRVWRDSSNALHVTKEFFDDLSSQSETLKATLQRGKDENILFVVGSYISGKKRQTAKPDPGIPCEWNGCHQLAHGVNKFCELHSVIVRARLVEMPNETRASVRETLCWSGSF